MLVHHDVATKTTRKGFTLKAIQTIELTNQKRPTRVLRCIPVASATRASDGHDIVDLTVDQPEALPVRTEARTFDTDCEPIFSLNDSFLQPLLSKFIQKLPNQLESVLNCTKKPRKMSWYIKYTQRIEHIGQPHVHVQLKNTRVAVRVENRVWLELNGSSTVTLLENVIRKMRDEAISWREFKFEVEKCLDVYRNRLKNDVDLASAFLRAWNNLKDRTLEFSLPRGTHYLRGTRLHHWSFVVGKVEIGSGSHEDKREAFRRAAASTAEFLLKLDDGQNERRWRPSSRDTSDDSDYCEFCFVRDVNSGSVAIAAAATLSDCPDSDTGKADQRSNGTIVALGTCILVYLRSIYRCICIDL